MRNVHGLAVALAIAGAVSCNRSDSETGATLPPDTLDHDASSLFAGAWYGTANLTVSGAQQPPSGTTELDIDVTGRNALTFPGFCGDGKGPAARVTSDSEFVLASYSCPVPLDSCTLTWEIASGGGMLANGTLVFSATGTAHGCGASGESMTVAFFGGRSATPPGATDRGPPTASAVSPVTTSPGAPVTLDASASADPDGRALTFSWQITQPYGTGATLTGATTAKPTFSSSIPGIYTVQVIVTATDGQSAGAAVTVKVVPASQAFTALTHRVAQAAYSRSLERIVMTDGSPNALYVYDPATGQESTVGLALPPQCLGLSPDGKYAVVGHNAWISYVDLASASVAKTIPVSADIGDCVLGGNGWAYLFPRIDQWVAIHNVEIATGVEVQSGSWQVYAGDRAVLSPTDPTALYVVTTGVIPAQIYRWDVSAGAATFKWQSQYWGDYAMGPELWFSADGARLLTAAGTAFRTSSTQAQDIVYGGRLSGITSVKHLDCSADEIAAIPATSSWDASTAANDTAVELFNMTYLGHVDRMSLPWWSVGDDAFQTHGAYVFHSGDGAKRYVIVQADGASGLLHDTTVLTY